MVVLVQETIRVEILNEVRLESCVDHFTVLNDEIFILGGTEEQYQVFVYDRHNMADVKDVIELPVKDVTELPDDPTKAIEACKFSNCVFVLHEEFTGNKICMSILRIQRDDEHQLTVSEWISGLDCPVHSMSVFSAGILSVLHGRDTVVLKNYNSSGSLVLSAEISGFIRVRHVLERSNGNLVLVSINNGCQLVLTEIDANWKTKQQYLSRLHYVSNVQCADRNGRLLIVDPFGAGVELIDSEFNHLQLDYRLLGDFVTVLKLHYDSERNEIMSGRFSRPAGNLLTTLCLSD